MEENSNSLYMFVNVYSDSTNDKTGKLNNADIVDFIGGRVSFGEYAEYKAMKEANNETTESPETSSESSLVRTVSNKPSDTVLSYKHAVNSTMIPPRPPTIIDYTVLVYACIRRSMEELGLTLEDGIMPSIISLATNDSNNTSYGVMYHATINPHNLCTERFDCVQTKNGLRLSLQFIQVAPFLGKLLVYPPRDGEYHL
jgi:8-oxo-dGTP pyrophosphatase MutT (NUDIX family)